MGGVGFLLLPSVEGCLWALANPRAIVEGGEAPTSGEVGLGRPPEEDPQAVCGEERAQPLLSTRPFLCRAGM